MPRGVRFVDTRLFGSGKCTNEWANGSNDHVEPHNNQLVIHLQL